MLKRRIIPCLDVKNGRIVKGVHFKGLRDAGDRQRSNAQNKGGVKAGASEPAGGPAFL